MFCFSLFWTLLFCFTLVFCLILFRSVLIIFLLSALPFLWIRSFCSTTLLYSAQILFCSTFPSTATFFYFLLYSSLLCTLLSRRVLLWSSLLSSLLWIFLHLLVPLWILELLSSQFFCVQLSYTSISSVLFCSFFLGILLVVTILFIFYYCRWKSR